MRQVRLLPLVAIAGATVLAFKAVALVAGAAPELNAGLAAWAQERPEAEEQEQAAAGGSRDRVLESLSERREALEERESELDLREQLLAATEERIEERIAELKAIEDRVAGIGEERREEGEARFAALVEMYQAMKPRDAARIFDRLDIGVLSRVAGEMEARQLAEILGAMDPEAAERLTVELSEEPDEPTIEEGDELPQIVGTPDEQ